jgi:hypothetical protein
MMCSDVFLAEDIEGRQADVEDFLLTESSHVTRCGVVLGRRILCWTNDRRGCAARQRQRPSDS